MLNKKTLVWSILLLGSNACLLQAAATAETINLDNYKDFVGKNAYAVLGIHDKNVPYLDHQNSRRAESLNPDKYRGTKEEHDALKVFDLLQQARHQLMYPGKSRDYQIKLAEMQGHTWEKRKAGLIYPGTRPFYNLSDYRVPPFDDGNWAQIADLEVAAIFHSGSDKGFLDVNYSIQLLARAVMENHRAILKLQGKSEDTLPESPEFETEEE